MKLEMTKVGLTKEQQLTITGTVEPPQIANFLQSDEWAPENERRAAAAMAEIQLVTDSNIQLINKYDQDIKNLEQELAATRLQLMQASQATKSSSAPAGGQD